MKKTITAILLLVACGCQKEKATTSVPLNQLSSSSSENLVQPLPDETVPDGPMTITQERNLYISAKDDILNVNVKNPYAVPLTTRNDLWKKAAMLGSGASTAMVAPGDDGGGQKGYTYSVTFYFDETWPFPNYYLTIYFDVTTGGGPITSVSYTMGNWGYYISGSFNADPNSYINFWGNSIVFNITGTQNAPTSLFGTNTGTNTTIINISGWVQTTTNGGVTGGQAALQPKGPWNP